MKKKFTKNITCKSPNIIPCDKFGHEAYIVNDQLVSFVN
jgi:hypothetical protein